jgi:hypothetical protein
VTILFVLASPEYLRFFDTTIALLAGRGHQAHVVFDEAAEYKPVGLSGAAALPLASATVIRPPRTFWGDTAFAWRVVVDYLRFLHPDYADAAVLRERIRRKLLPVAFQWLNRVSRLPGGVLDALLGAMRAGERALPVDPRVRETLASLAPDVVVVSPLVDAGSPQVDWIKGAQQRGIASAVAVASWDNLTNKGLMRLVPDRVFVWNEIQRGEAMRYHAVAADRIVVTGAAVFDRWFDRTPSQPREMFCARAGLPDAQPFVLFTGSSPFIADAFDEVGFVRQWIGVLGRATDPAVRGLRVIVRPHPYSTAKWIDADLGDTAAVVWPRGAFNPAADAGRRDLFDSLFHAAAVVGINTTAMIEAAIVGRPVLTVTGFSTQAGTLHFQYLLHENGGPVRQAATLEAHVVQLASALNEPRAGASTAQAFVHSFVRPQGLHDPSTPRLADAIEAAAALRPPRRSDAMARMALGPAMGAFGVYVAVVARLTGSDPFGPVRKHVVHPLRVARRGTGRTAARLRERTARNRRLAANRLRRADHVVRAGARRIPSVWKRCRRAMRQARYTLGMLRRGSSS